MPTEVWVEQEWLKEVGLDLFQFTGIQIKRGQTTLWSVPNFSQA